MHQLKQIISMLKWVGGISAATLLSVFGQLLYISHSAGRLEERVANQTVLIKDLRDEIVRMRDVRPANNQATGTDSSRFKGELRDG